MRGWYLIGALVLGGCVPSTFYYHSDNVRVDQDPARFKQFELDKIVCEGELAKANLSQAPGAVLVNTSLRAVYNGCMAQKGYINRG